MLKNKPLLPALCMAMIALLCSCSSGRTAIKAPEGMSRELKAAGLNLDHPSASDQKKWLTKLAESYTPWQKISISGSVELKQLPINPSVKIYMERGSLISISMRVPLLGEVGRVEIDRDSALLVNRKGGCYSVQPTARMLERIGVNLTDFQDLLLGRVFLAGSAPLQKDNVELFTLSEAAGGNYIVTPRLQRDDVEYGFTLYPDGKMLLAVAFTTDESTLLQTEYSYGKKKKTTLSLSLTSEGKKYEGSLDLDAPEMNPTPSQRISINPKWKRVSLRKLFTSF